MSSPADRPDLLRLLAQKIFGEQVRLFPWEERKSEGLMQSNRPAEMSPAQRERPSDLRDMNMGELERLIAEQEAAQEEGAANAVRNMPASPIAGALAAVSPDTYANMAETEGPGGEAPTMAAALTGMEFMGPGFTSTPRPAAASSPGGRRAPGKIDGAPLPDPEMKGKPLSHLQHMHTARWWDKFERAQEAGPVYLEKARTAAKRDWDTRFKQWQISNEAPQKGVLDQDFVVPSEGSARGVEPTMFQPAREARPAKPAAAPAAPKPEKPQFLDKSLVSVVAEPMPEPAPPPPGGITVDAVEGKPSTWRIRDPKSGLEQEFIGDRETADKHAKWLAQLSLRAEARDKLKAARAADKPEPAKPAEPPAAEPEPPANPAAGQAEAMIAEARRLAKENPVEPAPRQAEVDAAAESALGAPPEPPMTTGGGVLAPQGLPAPGSQMTRAQARVGLAVESSAGVKGVITKIPTSMQTDGTVTVKWDNGTEGRIQVSNLKPPPEPGHPPTRGQKKPKYSATEPVVGRRGTKKADTPKLAAPPEPTSPSPDTDPGAAAFHSKLMGALEKKVMGKGPKKVSAPEFTVPAVKFDFYHDGPNGWAVEGRDAKGKVVHTEKFSSKSAAEEYADKRNASVKAKK